MATIQQVAARAGVSVTTVSNALNGRVARMSEATLGRVRAAIEELNYRPSSAARQLKTGQVPVLGLLVPSIVNPMFATLAREIETVAKRDFDHRILLGNTYRQPREEVIFLEDLLAHGVRGAIVVSSLAEQRHFQEAIDRGMVMVNFDRRSSEDGDGKIDADNVSMNNFEAGQLATRSLIDAGCRNIAFATVAGRTVSRRDKIDGYLAAMAEAGLGGAARVVEGKAGSDYGDTELTELGVELSAVIAATAPRPDGIVALNDMMAVGLLAGFRRHGLHVPEDLSLAGIDDMPLSALLSPALTTVRAPVAEMAACAVRRLMARMEDPALPVEDFLFSPRLVSRESVRGDAL